MPLSTEEISILQRRIDVLEEQMSDLFKKAQSPRVEPAKIQVFALPVDLEKLNALLAEHRDCSYTHIQSEDGQGIYLFVHYIA